MYSIRPIKDIKNATMFGRTIPKDGIECESITDYLKLEKYNGVKATDEVIINYLKYSDKWIVEEIVKQLPVEEKKQVKTEENTNKQVKTAKKEA